MAADERCGTSLSKSGLPSLPLMLQRLPAVPVSGGCACEGDRYPSVDLKMGGLTSHREDASADWRHLWHKTQEALENTPGPHAVFYYKDARGRPFSTTWSAGRAREPFCKLAALAGSGLFSGHTVVIPPSGERMVCHWPGRDTFAVPAWSSVQHFNESRMEPAYLVGFHDGPFIDNLGLRTTTPALK
ncbi:hypothetical protein LLEC1_03749 [Akanthomyces lecanii]|uniref:Uncharacterized protein n=1 Tax=Cordyceps confragosa TaxID=2714763 RepID=A0A179IUW1_CORDF|nr:hypothetical protein LLEC1_03749 [Akanthomyces lecanii]